MNSVVIVAAGTGSRMKVGINKQFIKLNDKEIIVHTIEKFIKNTDINEIIVVIKKEEEQYFHENIIKKYRLNGIKLVHGGEERQDSVYNGLLNVNKDCEIVLVHDGARPFVNKEIISNSIKKAHIYKAIVVGVPVKDTIKVIDNENVVKNTPNRNNLWAVQTPQAFEYKLLIEAYETAKKQNYIGTDDAMLVEYIGQKVKMILGSYENIKITTKEDLKFGEQII